MPTHSVTPIRIEEADGYMACLLLPAGSSMIFLSEQQLTELAQKIQQINNIIHFRREDEEERQRESQIHL